MSGPPGPAPVHVLVIDDSAVVRQGATLLLSREPDMIVTVAADPIIALGKMGRARPDVILLDLEMPRMDGLTFLRKVMAENPIPVVVCSGLAEGGTATAIRALEEGAVDVIAKPALGVRDFLEDSAQRLIEAVRAAAASRVRPRLPVTVPERPAPEPPAHPLTHTTTAVVAIGASTGGTEALRLILEALPPDAPGHVVVQHMPERFTTAFAERLNRTCRVEVREATAGDRVRSGCVLLAPGNRHLVVRRSGAEYIVALDDGPPVSRHRPSVDVLFRSVARAAGPNAIGVILTGMGDDGAAGMAALRAAGASTIAQDEKTCVVFGMPRAAIERGGAETVLPLPRIPAAIVRAAGIAARRAR